MSDAYHDKLNWRNELLVITSEEASEVSKVVSKIYLYDSRISKLAKSLVNKY